MGDEPLVPLLALERLLAALLVGVLIGLDRERAEARKPHQLFAGIRTFPLIALAGAVPMLVIDRTGPALVIGSFLAVVALVLLSYYRTSTTGDVGAMTEMAALSTFLIGVLAGAGQFVGFVATRLLGERRGLSVTATIGALGSSTVVTIAMAERSRTDRELATAAAAATSSLQ